MIKQLFWFIIFILLSINTFAICTLTLDRSPAFYYSGNSMTVTGTCTLANEDSQAYTMTFYNQTGSVLNTETGTTPIIGSFFEVWNIPLSTNVTNGNVTLTGTNLEGEAFYNITSISENVLIITPIGGLASIYTGK